MPVQTTLPLLADLLAVVQAQDALLVPGVPSAFANVPPVPAGQDTILALARVNSIFQKVS